MYACHARSCQRFSKTLSNKGSTVSWLFRCACSFQQKRSPISSMVSQREKRESSQVIAVSIASHPSLVFQLKRSHDVSKHEIIINIFNYSPLHYWNIKHPPYYHTSTYKGFLISPKYPNHKVLSFFRFSKTSMGYIKWWSRNWPVYLTLSSTFRPLFYFIYLFFAHILDYYLPLCNIRRKRTKHTLTNTNHLKQKWK